MNLKLINSTTFYLQHSLKYVKISSIIRNPGTYRSLLCVTNDALFKFLIQICATEIKRKYFRKMDVQYDEKTLYNNKYN